MVQEDLTGRIDTLSAMREVDYCPKLQQPCSWILFGGASKSYRRLAEANEDLWRGVGDIGPCSAIVRPRRMGAGSDVHGASCVATNSANLRPTCFSLPRLQSWPSLYPVALAQGSSPEGMVRLEVLCVCVRSGCTASRVSRALLDTRGCVWQQNWLATRTLHVLIFMNLKINSE